MPFLRADVSHKVTLRMDVLQMQVLKIEAAGNNLQRIDIMAGSDLIAVIRALPSKLKEKTPIGTDMPLELREHGILSHLREGNTDRKRVSLRAVLSAMEVMRRRFDIGVRQTLVQQKPQGMDHVRFADVVAPND